MPPARTQEVPSKEEMGTLSSPVHDLGSSFQDTSMRDMDRFIKWN